MTVSRKTPSERLHARLVEQPNGCLEWTGAKGHKGYGQIWSGKQIRTHRLAWELANGPIPDGIHVLNHCDNPPCCNPEHLFLGTNADNVADKITKGRQGAHPCSLKTHCPQGHEYDDANTYVRPKDGSRQCRVCERDQLKVYRATPDAKAVRAAYDVTPAARELKRATNAAYRATPSGKERQRVAQRAYDARKKNAHL